MKFILVFSINIIFANVISEWIDLNNHIINSKSYKISFKQEYEATIGESTHYSFIPGSIIYFDNNIKYELMAYDYIELDLDYIKVLQV